jgi:hypothetical protein
MIILKKYIRNLDLYLEQSLIGQDLIFGMNIDLNDSTLVRLGFQPNSTIGDSILPSDQIGPICEFNARGKYIIHKDLPMETASRQAEWNWRQWKGRDQTEPNSKFVDIPYKRYPRTLIEPPSIEITINKTVSGRTVITSPLIKLTLENKTTIIHIINLILEIFGSCEVFTESLEDIARPPLRRLNWRILPPGKYPWERIIGIIEPILRIVKKGKRKVVEYKLETVSSYGPDSIAYGEGGFRGYMVFGFTDRNLFLLESMYYGNATYIFEDNWENLSKLTKAEIINGKLQKDRLIHIEGWKDQIHNLLKL